MNELIVQLEQLYQTKPKSAIYRRLWWLAFCTHFLIVAWVTMPVLALILFYIADRIFDFAVLFSAMVYLFLVTIALTLPPLIYLGISIRKLPQDEGVLLTKENAPELLAEIKKISDKEFGAVSYTHLTLPTILLV